MMSVRWGAAVGLVVLIGCASGVKVYRVDATPKLPERERWLVYSLPRAVIDVDVSLVRTQVEPGKCAHSASPEIADKLSRLRIEPMRVESTTVSVGNVALTQRVEPDPEQVFAVQLTSDLLDNSKFTIEMSEDGILTSGTLETSNKLVDTTVKTLSTAATIAAGAIAAGGRAPSTDSCLDVLRKIEEIRTKRETLLGGVSGVINGTPKDTLELMLSELRALESGYVAQFEGEKTVTTTTAHCEITPPTNTNDAPSYDVQLLSLSRSAVHAADASCSVAPAFLAPSTEVSQVTLHVAGNPTVARAASKLEPAEKSATGWYFRVPVRASVEVKAGDPARLTSKQRAFFYVPQFGSVVSLPGDEDIDASSITMSAKLGGAGGLISLGQATTAPDTAALADAVGSAGKTTLDALKANKNAGEKEELEQLEREKKRLELLRDIEKLKATQSSED